MTQALPAKRPDLETLSGMNERSREVFRHIVDAYVETGEPIGSRTLSRQLGLDLSPATIRNVMADLEDLGLLFAPHTSAGRMPTDLGLRLFVHGLLEYGNLTEEERAQIESQCVAAGKSMRETLAEASTMLSGLSRCAGLVVAPKSDSPLKHIEFVSLGPGRALVVIVSANGTVENRIIDVPMGLPASSLVEAGNYLTARLVGRTISEAAAEIRRELQGHRAELDTLSSRVIEQGLATWADDGTGGALIVRGQAQLLNEVSEVDDIERIRQLFHLLETKETMAKLLNLSEMAEGVHIYIGAENELFGLAGCSMIVAPYGGGRQELVGAIGVIGPSRIDYARIIPMVDYTAKVIGRLIG
ncbi:MAG: heat-inducible transcriptional repressor HrcA [Kiloniellales bacterium]|nr:heat-inducible transcriptional repressor HrcA [Kiloniellales bacterium]